MVHREANCWVPFTACSAAWCPLRNKDKGFQTFFYLFCFIIYNLLNHYHTLAKKKFCIILNLSFACYSCFSAVIFLILNGMLWITCRIMSSSMLWHLCNTVPLRTRRLMPFTGLLTPGSRSSHMSLMVRLLLISNCEIHYSTYTSLFIVPFTLGLIL